MGDQEQAQPSLNEVRGLAPGLLVSFAPKLWGTEETAANRTRFPHVSGTGLGEAAPDLLTFVSSSVRPMAVLSTRSSKRPRRRRTRTGSDCGDS